MGEIADLTSSKRVHAQDYVDSGIPFYRGKEISELREHKPVSEVLYITEEKYKEMAKLYGSPQVGDLLITAVGTIGNTWVVDNVVLCLYQRELFRERKRLMINDMNRTLLFSEYFQQWIDIYKKGAIREATMAKYRMTQRWVEKLMPELKVAELNRTAYQQLLNAYAKEHERQTTLDFHHQLKGAILDAVDDGLIERDPTRKAIIKGKTPRVKKIKYLSQFELHTLISDLNLKEEPNWDWFILLVAKT